MALWMIVSLVAALGTLADGQETPAPPAFDYEAQYDQYQNSAISMNGHSYYVNFDTPTGNISVAARLCYDHPTCVSFDFDLNCAGTCAWLHRITKDCAGSADAAFNTDADGSVFFQLNAAALLAKGLNKTRCSHVKEAYEPDYGTQSMVARLFAVTVGTFFLVGGVLYAVQHMLASRDRARLIEGIIDADEGMDAADDMHVDMPMVHPGQAGHAHRRPNPQPQRGQRPQPNLQPIN